MKFVGIFKFWLKSVKNTHCVRISRANRLPSTSLSEDGNERKSRITRYSTCFIKRYKSFK